jgi:hypothetical protein
MVKAFHLALLLRTRDTTTLEADVPRTIQRGKAG